MPQRIEFEGVVHEFPDDFTDADIAAALGEASLAAPSLSTDAGPVGVAAADAARRAAVRVGEEVATSPALGRVVRAASHPAGRMAARVAGASSGSVPGYIIGEAITSPAVTKAAETGMRAGGAALARVAGSAAVRTLTGLPGVIASMVTDAGDSPVGMTPETTATRQATFAHAFKQQVNAEAGYEVITGSTAPEIIESIARYRAGR